MITMRALKSQKYGTRHLEAGDEFDVRGRRHARLLTALHRAEVAPATPPPARRGRPPKAAAPPWEPEPAPAEPEPTPAAPEGPYDPTHEDDEDVPLEQRTRAELLAMAEARAIELPSGYVTRDGLIDLLSKD